MPVSDVQITRDGPVAVPLTYTLPASQEIEVRAVNADFDGTSAAGSWIPALVIEGQAGVVIARAADPANVVAAGSSAEVSWFPGVKNESAGTSGGTSLPTCFLDRTSAWTLTTWTPNVYTPVDWQLIDTNAAGFYAWPGSGGISTVAILQSGVYRCVYEYQVTGFNFPVAPGFILSKVTVSVAGATLEELAVNHTTADLYEGNPNVGTKWSPIGERLFNFPTPGDLQLDTANTRAGTVTLQPVVMFIYRVGDKVA